jgi:hypothetical protein
LRAMPLFAATGLAQRLIPGFFQGRKTLDGKRRRAMAEAAIGNRGDHDEVH